jgi:hypothetical protein
LRPLEKHQLDIQTVHANTSRMNLIMPLVEKILPLLQERFPACFRRRPARPPRSEIQLELPWNPKK